MSDNTAQGAREHLHRVLDERLAQCEALGTEELDAEAREGYSRALGTLKAVLAHADLSMANLSDAILTSAILSDALLNGTDLSGADMSDVDANRASFAHADLHLANLRGAQLKWAELRSANLLRTRIVGAHIDQAHWDGLVFEGLNLVLAPLPSGWYIDTELWSGTPEVLEQMLSPQTRPLGAPDFSDE